MRHSPLILILFVLANAAWSRAAAPGEGELSENPLRQAPTPTTPADDAASAPPAATATAGATNDGQAAALRVEPTPDSKSVVEPAPTLLNQKAIEARLAQVDNLPLTDAEKESAKTYYQNAIQATVELARQQALREQFGERVLTDEAARKELQELQHALDTPVEDYHEDEVPDPKSLTLVQLEERLAELERAVATASKNAQQAEAAPQKRAQRLAEIPQELQKVESDLEETIDALKKLAERGAESEVVAAKEVWLIQRAAMLEASKEALKAQRKSFEHASQLYEPRLQLHRRSLAYLEGQLARYRAALNVRRQEKAEDKVNDARQLLERNTALFQRNAALQDEASYNEALTQEIQQLVADLQKVTAEIADDAASADKLQADLDAIELQFEDPGALTQEGGRWLREKRAELPGLPELRRDVAAYRAIKSELGFRLFERRQRLQELAEVDSRVEEILAQAAEQDRQQAKPVVRNLLEKRQDYLQSLIHDYSQYSAKLGELLAAKQELIHVTEQFDEYIAKRELWIRSCEPLSKEYFQAARAAAAWSLDPRHWVQAGGDLSAAAERQPLLSGLLVIAFLGLLVTQRRARRRISERGQQAAKSTCAEFQPTFETLWLTAVVSLPWPLAFWGAGRLLEGPLVESEFTRALSHSLRATGVLLLMTEAARQVCRRGGLAEAHLQWPPATLQQLRRWLRPAPLVIGPLVLWGVGVDVQHQESLWSSSLGRLLFLALMALLTFAAYRLLMVGKSPVYQTIRRVSESRLMNAHRLWRPLLVGAPLLLGILAAAGYYFTAQQLFLRVVQTLILVWALMLTGGLLHRWVLLNRRQLAMQQLRQRRAATLSAASSSDPPTAVPAELPAPEETVDLSALSEQTRKLVRTALLVAGVLLAFGIWRDVFPALAWLDDAALPWFVRPEQEDPTTWGDLTRSLLALGITIVAVRHLPSLLELAVLQHLPIDQGARYATSTLARYALLGLGIVVVAATLGVTGTSISWLVAAMGVGLGFGLQEIFANFVSGIILLFERPIRVGDIVTLGETTGMVTKIRMRATTIIDWDRKEYVVPNKDLVVDRLLNWTLSDQTNRIVITVGVAYGSDTDRACSLLREIAEGHPEVMEDPIPLITFEGFGDSTLNLTLRCYLPNLERRLIAIHELHTEINRRFNAAGIEIAFPQRDLHIRSAPAEWGPRSPVESEATNGKQQPAAYGAADS